MKLIKIDPEKRTVEFIETPGTLDDIYALIGCELIDVCARQDTGDALFVDDEALLQDSQPAAFAFGDDDVVHGIALVTGSDGEGETVEPKMTLEEVEQRVTWLGHIHTIPSLTFIAFA